MAQAVTNLGAIGGIVALAVVGPLPVTWAALSIVAIAAPTSVAHVAALVRRLTGGAK